ncbi:hypothetical protein ACFPME_14010 [Rhodanobacter umsongensis]|uniref:MFS transporter n=1 Tax=Rhodanobacter umsongensis TaxID=633153 RepID=A0ABW0JNL1_9GAMM
METTAFQRPADSSSARIRSVRASVVLVLSVWFLLVVSLGATGAFVGLPGKPPIAIAISVTAPLLLFLACARLSQSFRELILALDLRLITGMQAWRWEGFGFLALYANHVLPAGFALTAGLGDMAIGFAAPWMVLGLVRQTGFAASAAFVRWNVLGMLDLLIAVCMGAVSAVLAGGVPGAISTAPMATLPLLLIPAFQVPLFLMLHMTALMQSRQSK